MLSRDARRVLVVDPDAAFASRVVEACHGAGLVAQAVADSAAGLRKLASFEPHVLVVELEMADPERGGAWLLRRLRDEYMGTRPRVVVASRPQAISLELADLGCDAVLVKPAGPAALVAACAEPPTVEPGVEAGRLRELVKVSILAGDAQGAFSQVAGRLSLAFRMSDCLLVGVIGDRQVIGMAGRPVDLEPGAEVWERTRVALDAGASVLTTGPDGRVTTTAAVPLESPGGDRLGAIVLSDDRARLVSPEGVDGLRALGTRLHQEVAWRSVHERIAADRDRLRESSMLDPLLGVWTRAALDQALPAEVSGAQRRREALTIAVLDVRGLRHLNERYGHLVGDSALQHVAALIRQSIRTQDIAARFSGDAIAVVLSGSSLNDSVTVVARLQDLIVRSPLSHGDTVISIQVTAGVASLQGEEDSGEAVLLRAAAACKAARRRDQALAVADPSVASVEDEASESLEHSLEAGATLGGMYQIVHEISRGAMGVVYRAEDLGLGRTVALKTLRPDLARDKSFVDRFRTEAATLASLRHENLVQVHAFGMDGEDVYFVMELVEGEPLEDRIELGRSDGRLMPFDVIDRVITQIASALDAMHRAGVLHRDVKPANILLDRVQDRAVLVDVGIAKRRGSPTDPAGTPGFTAPESFTGGREGPSTDVYGLAATAYMLCSVAPPFGEDGVSEILGRQMAGRPLPPSHHRPAVPAAVDEILLRALDPDPARRPISASAFARALASALGAAPAEVRAGLDVAPRRDPEAAAPESEPAVVVDSPLLGAGASAAWAQLGAASAATPQEPSAAPKARPADRRASTHVEDGSKSATLPISIGVPGQPAAPPGHPPSLREPERPSSSAPHTRGVLFRAAYRVLGARQAGLWVASIGRRSPALAHALQPQTTLLSWHLTEAFVEMLRAVAETGREPVAFARELGRVATRATFGRFFGADPSALTPWQVLASAELFWSRYHTWGKVSVNRQDACAADIIVDGGPVEPLVCASTAGILEQVCLIAGGGLTKIDHTSCVAARGEACVFHVRWDPRHDADVLGGDAPAG